MDLEQKAIERLRTASEMSQQYYEKPLVVAYSGGKDSDVCLELALRSGIPFEVIHSLTTADAPETIRHVKTKFHGLELQGVKCSVVHPMYKGRPASMWNLIPQKLMPPTRLVRYCCDILKEQNGKDRLVVTGVRWSESSNRKNSRGIYENYPRQKKDKIILNNDNDDARRIFENCKVKAKHICNPIVDWEDRDVWNFLRAAHVDTNPLYECGFSRVGCIGCPMAGKSRYTEFHAFPAYENMYYHSFARMVDARKAAGKTDDGRWNTPEGVWRWWMEDENLDGQINLFH